MASTQAIPRRCSRIILNVSGTIYEVDLSELLKHPECMFVQHMDTLLVDGVMHVQCTPRLFPFIFEYIIHGIRIDLNVVKSQTGIPMDQAGHIIRGFNFKDIFSTSGMNALYGYTPIVKQEKKETPDPEPTPEPLYQNIEHEHENENEQEKEEKPVVNDPNLHVPHVAEVGDVVVIKREERPIRSSIRYTLTFHFEPKKTVYSHMHLYIGDIKTNESNVTFVADLHFHEWTKKDMVTMVFERKRLYRTLNVFVGILEEQPQQPQSKRLKIKMNKDCEAQNGLLWGEVIIRNIYDFGKSGPKNREQFIYDLLPYEDPVDELESRQIQSVLRASQIEPVAPVAPVAPVVSISLQGAPVVPVAPVVPLPAVPVAPVAPVIPVPSFVSSVPISPVLSSGPAPIAPAPIAPAPIAPVQVSPLPVSEYLHQQVPSSQIPPVQAVPPKSDAAVAVVDKSNWIPRKTEYTQIMHFDESSPLVLASNFNFIVIHVDNFNDHTVKPAGEIHYRPESKIEQEIFFFAFKKLVENGKIFSADRSHTYHRFDIFVHDNLVGGYIEYLRPGENEIKRVNYTFE